MGELKDLHFLFTKSGHINMMMSEKQLTYDLTDDRFDKADDLSLPGDDVKDSVYAERKVSSRVEATHGSVAEDKQSMQSSSPSKVSCRVMHCIPTDAHYMNDDL